MKQCRNIYIDYFKLFLSVLVITAHVPSLFSNNGDGNIFNWLIACGIVRIAVPCFLVLNGYYIANKIGDSKFIRKYIIRFSIIYVVWCMIYSPIFPIELTGNSIIMFFAGVFHLWYIIALIISVFCLYFLKKWIKSNTLLFSLMLLLFLVGYSIQLVFPSRLFFFRNAFFFGLPFIFLGYYISQKEKSLVKIKQSLLLLIFALSLLCFGIELYFSNIYSLNTDLCLSLFLLCPIIIVLFLRYPKNVESDGYISKLASCIYFVHVLVINLLKAFYLEFPREDFIYYFPTILFISILASVGIIEINKRIKIFL